MHPTIHFTSFNSRQKKCLCFVESKSASKRICNYVCSHFVCNNVEGYYRLLLQLTVTAHEAVNTTCCIDKLTLTCVEWVRGA